MGKALPCRLFRVGCIRKDLYEVLETEEILFCEEGISGWILMKNLKAPGRRSWRRRSWVVGFLVLTRRRLVAYVFGKPVLDVSLDARELSGVGVLCHRNRIEISFDPSLFHDEWSGEITLRFKSPMAGDFCQEFEKISGI
ncbi:MAG: hypothetical protein JRJ48_01815 [Deltaproteobacteria bacterium]|nr:hypothetical protein [Deltaproteobacteria bacterium]